MRTIRYYLRLVSAFLVRFKGVLFLSVLFGLFLFVLIGFISPLFARGRTEYIGVSGRYHLEELPESVVSLIGDGLTRVDVDGAVGPGLAESWEASDSGKTWTFHLKDGLYWHDETAVTSETIHYSFNDVSIERPDSKTIVFKLQDTYAPFPSVVSRPVFKKGLLGTGGWKVRKLTFSGGYVESLSLTDSEGRRRVYRFYPTEERLRAAFKLGEVDKLEGLIEASPFDTWPTVEVEKTVEYGRYVAIFFNNEDPLFNNNKPLRQALAYSIDKDSFGRERALGPISQESWAYNPQVKEYEYSEERARELLSENKEQISIRLATTPALLPVAERVADYWRRIGVETTVQVTSILPSEYQAFLAMYDSPHDPDQYMLWHSTQTDTNISKYANPRINKLLEDGRLETKEEERKKIYLDFQRFLLEDSPAIFLYYPESYTIKRK